MTDISHRTATHTHTSMYSIYLRSVVNTFLVLTFSHYSSNHCPAPTGACQDMLRHAKTFTCVTDSRSAFQYIFFGTSDRIASAGALVRSHWPSACVPLLWHSRCQGRNETWVEEQHLWALSKSLCFYTFLCVS